MFTAQENIAAASYHFEATLTFVNGAKVAGQSDFDDSTGKIKASKNAKSEMLVLDSEKSMEVLGWLASSKSLSSSAVDIPVAVDTNVVFEVAGVEERKVNKNPPVPFITSSLQQVSSTQLGLSPYVAIPLYGNEPRS